MVWPNLVFAKVGHSRAPQGKIVQRPVVTKRQVHWWAGEDRDERKEEARTHCELETPEVQAERSRYQKCRGNSLVALRGSAH